jgi:hypothetical protein
MKKFNAKAQRHEVSEEGNGKQGTFMNFRRGARQARQKSGNVPIFFF